MESIVVDDAACLLLSLSSGSGSDDSEGSPKRTACKRRRRMRPTDGEFECKTCNRRFSSFQALGGHRTGHKRAKILNLKDILDQSDMYIEHRHLQNNLSTASTARKTQLHQCTICGEGFSMGQALGGHMRRHRADPVDDVEVEVASGLNMPLPSLEECGRSGEVFAAVPRKNTSHNIRLLELFV